MSNINAGLAISQFKRKEKIFSKRKKLANIYVRYLKNNNSIELLKHNYTNIVPHIFVVKIKKLNEKKKRLLKKMSA